MLKSFLLNPENSTFSAPIELAGRTVVFNLLKKLKFIPSKGLWALILLFSLKDCAQEIDWKISLISFRAVTLLRNCKF